MSAVPPAPGLGLQRSSWSPSQSFPSTWKRDSTEHSSRDRSPGSQEKWRKLDLGCCAIVLSNRFRGISTAIPQPSPSPPPSPPSLQPISPLSISLLLQPTPLPSPASLQGTPQWTQLPSPPSLQPAPLPLPLPLRLSLSFDSSRKSRLFKMAESNPHQNCFSFPYTLLSSSYKKPCRVGRKVLVHESGNLRDLEFQGPKSTFGWIPVYSPWDCKELDTAEHTRAHTHSPQRVLEQHP